jgi:serine/threonine protein kinase
VQPGQALTGDDPSGFDPLDVADGPKRLGHYVLLEKLGHGGMGVVYAAYDETLDRKVAIKLLRARASENTHQRLIREAQAMARLSHPNVVSIYEIEKLDDRTCVIMEFVDGMTLRAWMAEKRRSRREILEVFIAAGRGLAAAHQKSLIHRDFKPDNVMIAHNGRVQVMDFGLARGEEEAPEIRPTHPGDEPRRANALTTDLTADGAVIGTPAYMAPEQIEGRKTDPRSDQFSFCVTLWEALFERRPFSAGSLSEMSDVVSQGKFDTPERSKVPTWLRRVLRRGLASDRERGRSLAARDRRRAARNPRALGVRSRYQRGRPFHLRARRARDRRRLEHGRTRAARGRVRSHRARLCRCRVDARERVDERLRERVVAGAQPDLLRGAQRRTRARRGGPGDPRVPR